MKLVFQALNSWAYCYRLRNNHHFLADETMEKMSCVESKEKNREPKKLYSSLRVVGDYVVLQTRNIKDSL